jgi:hypothetical protein
MLLFENGDTRFFSTIKKLFSMNFITSFVINYIESIVVCTEQVSCLQAKVWWNLWIEYKDSDITNEWRGRVVKVQYPSRTSSPVALDKSLYLNRIQDVFKWFFPVIFSELQKFQVPDYGYPVSIVCPHSGGRLFCFASPGSLTALISTINIPN